MLSYLKVVWLSKISINNKEKNGYMVDRFIYTGLILSVLITTIGRKYFNNNSEKQLKLVISSRK